MLELATAGGPYARARYRRRLAASSARAPDAGAYRFPAIATRRRVPLSRAARPPAPPIWGPAAREPAYIGNPPLPAPFINACEPLRSTLGLADLPAWGAFGLGGSDGRE